jgi:hypothetical protein
MQNSPNDFGNYRYFKMPHYGARINYNYDTVQQDPSPFAAPATGATSMNNPQPHNEVRFGDVTGSNTLNPGVNAPTAHNMTQAPQPPIRSPQPVIHGHYPKIGTKRTRDASENFVKEKFRPSRRQKRDANAKYYYDDKMSDGDSDEEQENSRQGGMLDGRGIGWQLRQDGEM